MKSNDRCDTQSLPNLMIPECRYKSTEDECIKEVGTKSPQSPFQGGNQLSSKILELEKQVALAKEVIRQKNEMLSQRNEESSHLKEILS